MPVPITVVFSGLVALVAKKHQASAALLSAAAHVGHGVPLHFPMLVVQKAQLDERSSVLPKEVPDLSKHIKHDWLSKSSDWRAFEIPKLDLTLSSKSPLKELTVGEPSRGLDCPDSTWDDTGWLLQFHVKHPGLKLKTNWDRDSSVESFMKIEHGVISGAPPVNADFPTRVFKFGDALQAFTDAFRWTSFADEPVVIEAAARTGSARYKFAFYGDKGPLLIHIMNQPADPTKTTHAPVHVAAVYDLPFDPKLTQDREPLVIDICTTEPTGRTLGKDAVERLRFEIPRASGDSRKGDPLGGSYCMSPIIWLE
jgi:hypothetical protein